MEANEDISGLLQAWSDGTPGALDRLMPLVHEELRRSAVRAMARERPEHTLEPGALVNEVYLADSDEAGHPFRGEGGHPAGA